MYGTHRRFFYDDCIGFLYNRHLDRTAQKEINDMDDMCIRNWFHMRRHRNIDNVSYITNKIPSLIPFDCG